MDFSQERTSTIFALLMQLYGWSTPILQSCNSGYVQNRVCYEKGVYLDPSTNKEM